MSVLSRLQQRSLDQRRAMLDSGRSPLSPDSWTAAISPRSVDVIVGSKTSEISGEFQNAIEKLGGNLTRNSMTGRHDARLGSRHRLDDAIEYGFAHVRAPFSPHH